MALLRQQQLLFWQMPLVGEMLCTSMRNSYLTWRWMGGGRRLGFVWPNAQEKADEVFCVVLSLYNQSKS